MADLIPDARILPVLTRLLGCVDAELTAAGIETCFTGIVSGAMADSTHAGPETGNMAWLRMGEVVPILPEGVRAGTMSCNIELRVDVEVGFFACYPIHEDGEPLTVEENLLVTDEVHAAMMAMHRGINCCDWPKHPDSQKKVGYDVTRWLPAGPNGGVVGGAWFVQVIV